MSHHFVKVSENLLRSSIMDEALPTRFLWIVILTMANRDGNFRATPTSLARTANIPLPDVEEALRVLQAPDPMSSTPDDEGRRLEAISPNEWAILNFERYRDLRDPDDERRKTRDRVRKHRAKKKAEAGDGCDVTPDVTPGNKKKRVPSLSISPSSSLSNEEGESEGEMTFGEWWDLWTKGRKVDRAKCQRFWIKLSKRDRVALSDRSPTSNMEKWRRYFASLEDVTYVPHPYTFLNNRRWEDDPPPVKKGAKQSARSAGRDYDGGGSE